MRTELVDELVVERYTVFAEMAWLERRPELGVICRLARDSGGRITPSVVEQALPGLSEVGSANVVHWCEQLGICDRSGGLTGLGAHVAEADEAPVPEQGIYDVWVARHELLGSRLLHVERLTASRDGRFRFDVFTAFPVAPDRDRAFSSVVEPQRRFVLRALPSNHGSAAAILAQTSQTCRVRWTLDWRQETDLFRLEGTLGTGGSQQPVRHEPETAAIDLWRLLQDWASGPLGRYGTWSAADRRLVVDLAELSVVEQESFVKELELGDVEVPGFGRWRDVRLSDVPIGAGAATEAQHWAMERLGRRLEGSGSRYTRLDVRRQFADLTEGTPLAPYEPTLPAHDTLLARYDREPEVFWRLAAPVDLAPLAPSREELGPMTVGERASSTALIPDDRGAIVRLPYGGRSSMRQLVDRLTGGPARRLLLVDRYVRGASNLASLRLLVTTVQEQGLPGIDVWTGSDVDTGVLDEIEGVTGRRPRRYQEVFGSVDRLHDRYLVVVPQHGSPFGWHMSNSLLDGRTSASEPSPDTDLVWRDLIANRLSIEQLHERMSAWTTSAGQ